jgi:hypothetical protein
MPAISVSFQVIGLSKPPALDAGAAIAYTAPSWWRQARLFNSMLQWIGVTSKYLIHPNRAIPLRLALSGFLVYGEISVKESPFSLYISGPSLIFSVFGFSEVATCTVRVIWITREANEPFEANHFQPTGLERAATFQPTGLERAATYGHLCNN